MKRTVVSSFAVIASMISAPAANIAWVSFHPGDDTPSAAAATAGFTEAPDVGFTDLLTSAGHTVTRFTNTGNPNVTHPTLNTYDLIIVSRSSPSGDFANANADNWNTTITAPVMIMSGYAIRQSRLGLTAGSTIPDVSFPPDNNGATTLTLGSPLGLGVMADPYVTTVAFNGNNQRGPSVVTGALQGGGTVWASVSNAPNPDAIGAAVVAFWEAGSSVTHAGGAGTNILAGDRAIFLAGSREQTPLTSEGAGIYDLTAEGEDLFLRTVDLVAVPEPSSAALVILGALAVGIRRRRLA